MDLVIETDEKTAEKVMENPPYLVNKAGHKIVESYFSGKDGENVFCFNFFGECNPAGLGLNKHIRYFTASQPTCIPGDLLRVTLTIRIATNQVNKL